MIMITKNYLDKQSIMNNYYLIRKFLFFLVFSFLLSKIAYAEL